MSQVKLTEREKLIYSVLRWINVSEGEEVTLDYLCKKLPNDNKEEVSEIFYRFIDCLPSTNYKIKTDQPNWGGMVTSILFTSKPLHN